MTISFRYGVVCVAFLCALESFVCQVTDTPRDQPLIFSNHATQCCQFLESSKALLNCANQSAASQYSKASSNSRTALVSYSTSGILDYGAYSLAVNALFAEVNDYGMRLLTPEDGARYEPRDERWNKVKILVDALDPVEGWGRDLEYIVWLDSDLIFLDMGMKIDEVMKEHYAFDIVFSADPHIENGVVNSGLFIVKNTEWSRQFLADWWSSYDRIMGMDQHIFSKLWETGQPDIAKHIKILRPDALNSHFPSWEHQHPHNQVLHLAGVSGIMRQLAFKKAFSEICAHVNNPQTDDVTVTADGSQTSSALAGERLLILPRQLGADRAFLEKLYRDLPRGAVVDQILTEMHGRTGKDISYAEITKLSRSLADVLQMGFLKEAQETGDSKVAERILEGLAWTYNTLHDVTAMKSSVRDRLEGVQLTLEAMFSYTMRLSESDMEEALRVLKEAEPMIDYLLANVGPNSYGPSLYYKFKHREFPCLIYEYMGMPKRALAAYKEAMEVWWEMHKYKSYGSGNGVMDPYFEGSIVLERIAALSMDTGDLQGCVDSVQSIVGFYNEIWASKTADIIPEKVLREYANRLALGTECANKIGNKALTKQFNDKAVATMRLLPRSTQTEGQLSRLEEFSKSLGDVPTATTTNSPPPVSSEDPTGGSQLGHDTPIAPQTSKRMFRRKKKTASK